MRFANPLSLKLKHVNQIFSRHRNLRAFSSSKSRLELDPNYPVTNVAVLGGGITGLTSAFYLTKAFPSAKVTIFESSERLGGWIKTFKHEVQDGDHVYFEHGPRTLRPVNAAVTMDLLQWLDLGDELLTTSKRAPAALRRYIYYPDHLVLMPHPSTISVDDFWKVVEEPVFDGYLLGLLKNQLWPQAPRELQEDESIASWVSRRIAPAVSENLFSAGMHGIYAGDIDKLSVQSILPWFTAMEATYGSVIRGMWSLMRNRMRHVPVSLLETESSLKEISMGYNRLEPKLKDASTFTLKGGLERFPKALVNRLAENSNVTFHRQTTVTRIIPPQTDQQLLLETSPSRTPASKPPSKSSLSQNPQRFTHLISTISPSALLKATHPLLQSSPIASTPAVTVMVVTLYYTNPSLLARYPGFGYLIPRSVSPQLNPELALGVVFDSLAVQGLDTARGTKLTVMLGGHYWDSFLAGGGQVPSEEEGKEMAMSVLERHLGIREQPVKWQVGLQWNAIPQYTVGFGERMGEAHEGLVKAFGGRVRVAGAWYQGVGVNDCVKAGFDVVMGLKGGGKGSGLERVRRGGEEWRAVPVAKTGEGS